MLNQSFKRVHSLHQKNFTIKEIAAKTRLTPKAIRQALYGEAQWSEYKDREEEKVKARQLFLQNQRERFNAVRKAYSAKKFAAMKSRPNYYLTSRLKRINANCTPEEFIAYIGNPPICHLTGRELSYSNPKSFHIEHKIPIARGGTSDLSNLAIACPLGNLVKATMTTEEFINFCKEVTEYHGKKSGI